MSDLSDIQKKAAAPILPDDPESGTKETVALAAQILDELNDDPALGAVRKRPCSPDSGPRYCC